VATLVRARALRLLAVLSGADRELEDVRLLHRKFGLGERAAPGWLGARARERVEFLAEELRELSDAVRDGDLPGAADALVDLVVVAKGTAVLLGLPWEECWREVQRANLAKERGVGKRGHAVDLVKPPGWRAPDHAPALRAAGWVPDDTELLPDDGRGRRWAAAAAVAAGAVAWLALWLTWVARHLP
jgi:predicted HAD superfamily Cof-like phosphohydrolase